MLHKKITTFVQNNVAIKAIIKAREHDCRVSVRNNDISLPEGKPSIHTHTHTRLCNSNCTYAGASVRKQIPINY